jgi:pre-mRNA-splicing factor CWC26
MPASLVGSITTSTQKKTTTWKTFGAPVPSTNSQLARDEAATADAIITAAADSRTAAAAAEDEAPEMLDTENILKMSNGAHAGLQTAAQVAAAMKVRQDEDRKKAAAVAKEMGALGAGDTIYRDASGRIINVAMKRAEARRAAEKVEKDKLEAEKAARGDVQRLDAEKRKKELDDAKYMTLARGVNDVEMNEELKEQDRWNDPAAGFVKSKKSGKSRTGRPLYKGAAPPNRYGIRPGHRWDGVDRANGFEAQWFKARNRKGDRERMEYAWQMDE